MKGFKRHVAVFLSYISIFIVIFSNFGVEASAAEKTELEKVSGQIILKLKSEDDKSYEKIIKKYKGKIQDSQDGLVLVSLDNEDIPKLVKEARNNSNIEYTEVNALGNKSGVPSDELLDTQYYLKQSNTISAWNSITDTAKKKEVKVAIVDSGIKTSHSEFKGEIISAKNIITGSTNVEDDNGHGTEIAGIIAAKHDGKGIAGIAGLLNIKLIPVKVLDKNGAGTTYNISKGIKYAADKGAQIINISINGKGYSKVINDAIKYAISKKALVIVSAPNIENYNNSAYAKGYWPCSSDGVIVAGGEKIKDINNSIGTDSYGYTTNISSDKYGYVYGNSYSTAIVTGAAALLKVTKPSDSISQLANILVNSTNEYDKLDVEKSLSIKSDFIEVVSPTSSNIFSGDVQGKVAALSPTNLKKMSIYVNSTDNLIKSINSTGAKEYSFTIPSSKILESTNKLIIKAEDKAGKSYISETYFSYEINDKGVVIEVKDQKGKTLSGALVELKDSYGKLYGQALTDSLGIAKFQGEELAQYLDYNNILAVVTNGNKDSGSNNLYYVKNITKGRNTINLSTDGKEITISGKKADGKYLTKGKIYLDKYYSFDSSSSGQTKIIVNKDRQLNVQMISQEEGYMYSKFLASTKDISKIEFKVDSSVGKLDIKNALDSNIVNETLGLRSANSSDYSNTVNFNVKNRAVYLTKGEYLYYYSVTGKKANEGLGYFESTINITGNKVLSFGIPTINSKVSNYEEKNRVLINLTDPNTKKDIIMGDGNSISVSLVDSKNKSISKDKYSFKINKYNGSFQSLEVTGNKIDLNNTKANIKVSILGKTLTTTVKLGGTTTSTKIAEISYKLPKDMDSLIKSDGNITSYLSYYVYDSKTKARVYSGRVDAIKKQGSFYIPTTYANNKYGISVLMNFADKNIFYDRTLSAPVNNKVYINSDKGEAKRITLSGKELSKIVPNNSPLNISNGVANLTANVNGKSTYTWIDKGNYEFNVYNSNAYILGNLQISSTSSNINFDKFNLGKFTVKAPIDSNRRTVNISLDNNYGFTIPTNKQILMSTSKKIIKVQVNTKDRFGNLNSTIDLKGNVAINSGVSKILDLTNLNVTYKDMPTVIKPTGNLRFSSIIKSSDFTVESLYRGYPKNYSSLNFIRTNGTIAEKARIESYNGLNFSVYDYAVQPGDYTLKLDLLGVGTKDSGVKVKVNSTDQIAIKIMDPNNTSKPLANATVIFGGQKKITDVNGIVYWDKLSLIDLSQIKILIENENELYMYTPASKSVNQNQTIVINKNSLKKATIKSDGLNKNLNFKNALGKIEQNSVYFSKVSMDFKLNSSGQKTIYYNDAISKVNIIGDNFILESSNPEKSKFVINTKGLGKVSVLDSINNYTIMHNGNNFNMSSNTLYISPGSVQYNIYKNGFNYVNSFNIQADKTKTVRFGTKFSFKATNIDTGNRVPYNNLNNTITITDEYGNKVLNSAIVKANVYHNGTLKEKVDVGSMYPSNGVINANFSTSVVYSSIQYDFDVTINNVKYKTNKITIKYDLSKYQTVNVKDPLGKNIVSGELRNSKTGTINKVINGKTYIEKTSIASGAILSLKGVNTSGDIVVYNDYKVTSSTKEIKLTSAKKLAMNISLPKTASDYGNYCFFVKSLNGDGDEIYKENISDKAELVKKYSGKNLWINSGEYVVGVSYSKYNSVQEYYLLGKIVNKATTSVKIDGSSLTNIGLSYDNNKITPSNIKYTVNGYDVLNPYGTDSKVYVTPSLINGYRIGASKKDNYEYFSYRKDGLKVSGSSYKISLGDKISAKLEYNGKSTIPENNIIKSYITLSDEYKNIITEKYFYTTAIVSIGEYELERNYYNTYSMGDKIEAQFTASQKYPEMNVKYEVDFLGNKLTTNSLKYSGDTSSYKIINVLDPNGQPLASGTLNKGWGTPYIIANGKAYINKTDNLEYNKFTMVGNNKAGELVVYTNLSLNSSTKEIKDTTVKQVSMNINLPSKFDNNDYYEFVIKKLESNNYNEYSRYNLTKDYLIKNYSGKKMWISGGDHFIGIRYTKYITGLDNEYYLMGSLVTKDTKNIKIDGSSLTNITLDYDKNKLDINNIEFTVNECSILSKWYDSNTKIYVTPSLIKGYNISAYDKKTNQNFYYNMDGIKISGSIYKITLGNKFTAKVEDVNKGIIPESREIENNITIKDEYNNDVYTHDGIDVTSTIYVSGKETDKYWDYIYFGDGKLNKKTYLYREYSEFELTHEFNFLGNKFTTNTLKYSKI